MMCVVCNYVCVCWFQPVSVQVVTLYHVPSFPQLFTEYGRLALEDSGTKPFQVSATLAGSSGRCLVAGPVSHSRDISQNIKHTQHVCSWAWVEQCQVHPCLCVCGIYSGSITFTRWQHHRVASTWPFC